MFDDVLIELERLRESGEVDFKIVQRDELYVSLMVIRALNIILEKLPNEVFLIKSSLSESSPIVDKINLKFYHSWQTNRAEYPCVIVQTDIEREKQLGFLLGVMGPSFRVAEGEVTLTILHTDDIIVRRIRSILLLSLSLPMFYQLLHKGGISSSVEEIRTKSSPTTQYTYSTVLYFSSSISFGVRLEGLRYYEVGTYPIIQSEKIDGEILPR